MRASLLRGSRWVITGWAWVACFAVSVAGGCLFGCNAVSGKQGVIDYQKTTQIEAVAEQNAEVIRNAAVAVESRQNVATSQPVAASVGGVHLGGGVSSQTLNVAASQPASASVGGLHVGGGTKTERTTNVGTDPWLYRGTVWGAMAGAFLLCAWFAWWQARRHGYEAGRKRRLRGDDQGGSLAGRGWPLMPPPQHKPPAPAANSMRPWANGPPAGKPKPPPPPAPPPPPKGGTGESDDVPPPPPPPANETTTSGADPSRSHPSREEIVKGELLAMGLVGSPAEIWDALLNAIEFAREVGVIATNGTLNANGHDLQTQATRLMGEIRKCVQDSIYPSGPVGRL